MGFKTSLWLCFIYAELIAVISGGAVINTLTMDSITNTEPIEPTQTFESMDLSTMDAMDLTSYIMESEEISFTNTDVFTTEELPATNTVTEEPSTTYTATEEPSTTDTATEEPSTTYTATEEPSTTDTATEEPSTTDTATEEPSTTDTATEEPSITDTATEEPSITDTATEEPSITDTATEEPSITDTATEEPSTPDTVTVEPSATETETEEITVTDMLTDDVSITELLSSKTSTQVSASSTQTESSETSSTEIAPTSTVTVATSVTPIDNGDCYPYGYLQGDSYFNSDWPQISDTIYFASSVPFGGDGFSFAHVLYNGILTFGSPSRAYYPSLEYAFGRFQRVAAPFWAYFDWYDEEARVFYHLYERDVDTGNSNEEARKDEILARATSDVRDFSHDNFTASTVLVATWDKVRPVNWYSWICQYFTYFQFSIWYQSLYQEYCLDFLDPEVNTFQAVYATDGECGYLLFCYQLGEMRWRFEFWRKIIIGYANGDDLFEFADVTYTPATTSLDTDVGNTGIPGYYIFKVGQMENPIQRCREFVTDNAALINDTDYLAHIEGLYQCPCSLDRLQRQWWWYEYYGTFEPGTETIICYALSTVAKNRLPRLQGNPLNKICCYSFIAPFPPFYWLEWWEAWRASPYIDTEPYAGRILAYDPWSWRSSFRDFITQDVQPHKWCCIDSNVPSLTCPKFHEIRPLAGCSVNVTTINARLLGDPHVKTLDGREYTMNGWGEYILLKIESDEFMLQGRTERAVGSDGNFTKATVFVAFVAQLSTDASFQAELNDTKDGMVLMANGIDITINFYTNTTFNEIYADTVTVSRTDTGDRVEAIAAFGNGVTLKVYPSIQNLQFSLEVDPEAGFAGSAEGLLGNFNGDQTDEFITSAGTNLGNNLTQRQIFEDFASTWQVTSLTTIFSYPTGLTALDFQHSDFEPLFLEEANQTLVALAEDLCGAGNNTCIFDFLATEDESFATNTLNTDLDNQAQDESLANNPPNVELSDGQLNPNGYFVVENEETYYITVTGSDPDGDEFTFKLRPHNAGDDLTINSSGVITYIANTSFPVLIQVFTEDSHAAVSQVITIPITGCTGCSDNGECDDSVTRDQEFMNGNFILFVCNCGPAWTGVECESNANGCEEEPCIDGQNCTDLTPAQQGDDVVGYVCGDCAVGYEVVGDPVNACIDVNECNDTASCTNAMCLNTEGSFTCECSNGYRETNDDTVCEDLDECVERLDDCDQVCVNTDGGFNCTCFEGYTLNNDGQCQQDADLTDFCDSAGCSDLCLNVSGVPTCACPSGYAISSGDPTQCEDVDECSGKANPCQQICMNLEGSYNCSCRDGFQLARDGQDCEECEPPFWGPNCQSRCACSGRGTCESQRGCVCLEGWMGENCNIDVDECTDDPNACKSDQTCTNTLGNFTCTCIAGYLIDDDDDCEDIDECEDVTTHDCDLGVEECVNNVGSFRCDCQNGFTRDNSGTCVDVDECAAGIHTCDQICENVPGFFNCRCQFGFRLASDRETCEQIEDVCASFNITCQYECTVDRSTSTAFCICPTGFGLIGETECEDIDECDLDHLNLCAEPELCVNTNGSYICSCSSGFRLDNDGRSCTECTGGTWGLNCANDCSCTEHAVECSTRVGCICDSGYTGTHCEDDIDECNTGAVICSASQMCQNVPGTAVCGCPDGYVAINNTACEDLDECASSADNDCIQECTNTPGSYICSCFDGYKMDDGECEDVNECDEGLDNCAETCVNLEGRFRCECPNGFELGPDGASCVASKVCDTAHSCAFSCADVNGVNTCFCPLGKRLNSTDNESCDDIDLCDSASCEEQCREVDSNTTTECFCNVGNQLNSDGFSCSECPDGTYGDECSGTCACIPLNTDLCNTTDGTCTCKAGWAGVDCSSNINECVDVTHNCPDNSTCQDTDGSFVCICEDGYFKDGDSCTECTANFFGKDCASVCLCDRGDCNPVDGSCDCDNGWEGVICSTDVNECQTGGDDCALENRTNWVCFNTPGSFGCDCADGYDDNGVSCTNINECSADHLNQCNQLCTDTDGSYVCSCYDGYELDGNFTCVDIDECTTQSPCDQVCTNVDASFTCSCNFGYSLEDDNVTCFGSFEYVFTVTLDTSLSFVLDPTNPLYTELLEDLDSQVTSVLSRIVVNFVRYIISLIRLGSVIVDGTSIVRDIGNHRGTMVEALIVLATTEITVENRNVTPVIVINGTEINITAQSNKCEIVAMINPCPSGTTCVVSGGLATCEEDDDDLNIPLIVGLSVGIPLLVIVIVLIVVVLYLKKKNTKLARVASREGYYNDNISRPPSGSSNGGLLLNEDK